MSIKKRINHKGKAHATTPKISPVVDTHVDDMKSHLTQLAHEGTKESIEKIAQMIKHEKDPDLVGFARCAYDEASFFYYDPMSETEERDFQLAKMIREREMRIDDLECELESKSLEWQRIQIDKEVHDQIIKANPKSVDWKYRLSEDLIEIAKRNLSEIEEDIHYEEAWIQTAKKMIKARKYQSIPADVLDSIHLDGLNDEDDCPWPEESETR